MDLEEIRKGRLLREEIRRHASAMKSATSCDGGGDGGASLGSGSRRRGCLHFLRNGPSLAGNLN